MRKNTDEIVDLVDEKDNIIGEALKAECHKRGLWHRAVTIFVFDEEGKLLVQKRAPNMPRPNLLGASASGHLRKGETYEAGTKRELKEELGIECKLTSLGKFSMEVDYPDGKIDKEHYKIFLCNYDGKFNRQKEELSSICFFSIEDIKSMMNKNINQFTPGFQKEFQHYLNFISGNG